MNNKNNNDFKNALNSWEFSHIVKTGKTANIEMWLKLTP